MTLKSSIENDFLAAYKSHQDDLVSVLRMVKNTIKNFEINSRVEASEQDIIKILRKEIKQREDAANEYEKAGRLDLCNKERSEAKVINNYLPSELSESETQATINDAIAELGATGIKDMGSVIKLVMAKTEGRADGSKVAQLVKNSLTS